MAGTVLEEVFGIDFMPPVLIGSSTASWLGKLDHTGL
jgi:hypothetical protein